MADENETKEQSKEKDSQAESSPGKSLAGRLLPWIVLTVVVLSCAGAGFGLGRLFGGPRTAEAPQPKPEPKEQPQAKHTAAAETAPEGPAKAWYYDLDPVVANLNEPSVTRYVRATFTLEVSAEMEKEKGTAFLNERKPVLINWLTVYLSSLRLDDIRGDKNLKSIQSQVCAAFNEKLFPDSKPQINQVLIKEFPVQ